MNKDRDLILGLLMDCEPHIAAAARFPNHCILATKIGLEVLNYFEIEATPLPVIIWLYNQAYADCADAGMKDANEFVSHGAFSVGINKSNPGKEWNGHLLIDLHNGDLLDLNFGQFSRPSKQIVVPVAAAFRDFTYGEPATYIVNQSHVCITADPTNVIYKNSNDWKLKDTATIGKIITAIKTQTVNG